MRKRSALAACVTLAMLLALAPSAASAALAHCGAGGASGCTPTGFGAGVLTLAASSETTAGSGVAVDEASGDVYVADTGGHRIAEFDAGGQLLRVWGAGVADGAQAPQVCAPPASCRAGLAAAAPGELEAPTLIAVDQSTGDVYVGDASSRLVTKFSSEGALIASWGDNGPGESADGQLSGTKALGPLRPARRHHGRLGRRPLGLRRWHGRSGKRAHVRVRLGRRLRPGVVARTRQRGRLLAAGSRGRFARHALRQRAELAAGDPPSQRGPSVRRLERNAARRRRADRPRDRPAALRSLPRRSGPRGARRVLAVRTEHLAGELPAGLGLRQSGAERRRRPGRRRQDGHRLRGEQRHR